MIALSTRAKEAIKVGLAMVLVYAIAMQMGWDKLSWSSESLPLITISYGSFEYLHHTPSRLFRV